MTSVRAFFRNSWYSRAIVRRRDLDHQPVFEPELDDMEKRLLPLHAAAEGLGAPALARADPLDLLAAQRHRDQHMERPGLAAASCFAEHDLIVIGRNSSVACSG